MKIVPILICFVSTTLFLSTKSFSQSKNVQDAYNKFKSVNLKNDSEKNLRSLEEARIFIDLAADNPETKEDPKMHFYRGQIYMSLYELNAQQAMVSGNVDQTLLEGYKAKAAESFIFCLNEPKKKFKDEVLGMAELKFNMMFDEGVKKYNEKSFEQALILFFQAYDVKNMLNLDYGDSKKNGIICMNQIIDKLISSENPDFKTAILIVEQIRTQFPMDIDILISLINIHLRNNDLTSAEKFMNEAVALDPTNKVLHYNLGTSYMNQGLNARAEESLNKALEIDPSYKDAQYQLGAHLYNWANEVNKEANDLNSNDPKVPELEKQSGLLLQKSLNVLEKYIENNPNDKDILGIIYKTHYKLGNAEKGKEYKARFDAIK
ncbi:MAG: tetratricopeptide repeat protein [Bacteroidetes bacterium]|nr:tetratricopeptide repeat protein [Bacteroidota bacterium]